MSVKIKFTQRRVADLESVPGKQFDVWDTDQPRFGVRVSPGGSKTFFVLRRVNGKPVRSTVGVFPEMNVDTARVDAAAMLVDMQKGNNPNIDKKRKRDNQADKRGILSALLDQYIASGGIKGEMKATTAAAYRYAFKRLAKWHGKRVEEITSDMAKDFHAELVKNNGGYAANHAIGLLRSLMVYSMDKYKRPAVNPTDGVKWFKETARRKSMDPETIPDFLKALDELKGDTGSDLFRMLLFTGMRKSEAMGLAWTDINLENKSLLVADTKTGTPLDIPISGHLAEMLTARKERLPSGCKWVFPSNSRVGHATNTDFYVKQIAEHGVAVYPHLLRKTFTTIASTVIPGAMVDCLTGHIPEGVTGKHYTFPHVSQLRPHTEKVTKKILQYAAGVFEEDEEQ
jgi:integrase